MEIRAHYEISGEGHYGKTSLEAMAKVKHNTATRTECGPAARTDSSWPLQSLEKTSFANVSSIQTRFLIASWQRIGWIPFDPTWPILNGWIILCEKSGTILGNPSFDGSVYVSVPRSKCHASGRPPKALARAGVLTDWPLANRGSTLPGMARPRWS